MLKLICVLLAAAVVAVVVAVALAGWAGAVPRLQRLALAAIAAGLVWAGPDRFSGRPPGFGDLVLLAGVLAYIVAVYGRQLRAHLDAMDGKADGRIDGAALANRLEVYGRTGIVQELNSFRARRRLF